MTTTERLPARRDPAAASKAARALTPLLGAGRTHEFPAPAEQPAQLAVDPGAGFLPQ